MIDCGGTRTPAARLMRAPLCQLSYTALHVPGGIRTPGIPLRRRTLCPTELLGRSDLDRPRRFHPPSFVSLPRALSPGGSQGPISEAGDVGIEPTPRGLEALVLPLHQSPSRDRWDSNPPRLGSQPRVLPLHHGPTDVTGFEPAISCVTGRRFRPLSYTSYELHTTIPQERFELPTFGFEGHCSIR